MLHLQHCTGLFKRRKWKFTQYVRYSYILYMYIRAILVYYEVGYSTPSRAYNTTSLHFCEYVLYTPFVDPSCESQRHVTKIRSSQREYELQLLDPFKKKKKKKKKIPTSYGSMNWHTEYMYINVVFLRFFTPKMTLFFPSSFLQNWIFDGKVWKFEREFNCYDLSIRFIFRVKFESMEEFQIILDSVVRFLKYIYNVQHIFIFKLFQYSIAKLIPLIYGFYTSKNYPYSSQQRILKVPETSKIHKGCHFQFCDLKFEVNIRYCNVEWACKSSKKSLITIKIYRFFSDTFLKKQDLRIKVLEII